MVGISERIHHMSDARFIDHPAPAPVVPATKEGIGEVTTDSKESTNGQEVVKQKPSTIIVSFGKPGGAGGLVSGVGPFVNAEGMKPGGSAWIYADDLNGHGEPGGSEEALRTEEGGHVTLMGVGLSKELRRSAYESIANEQLWPMLHGLTQRITPGMDKVDRFWKEDPNFLNFQKVQTLFAQKIAENLGDNTFTLVNDYHLPGVAAELRNMGYNEARLGFFLHTPVPDKESFLHLPAEMQRYFLEGLLAYDYVGLQTAASKENFMEIVKEVLKPKENAIETVGNATYITWNGRRVKIEDNPIGIDTEAFKKQAQKPEVLQKIDEIKEITHDEFVYFYLGRRDYTKGIPQFIEAIDLLLEKHPELIGKVRFLIAAPPSRPDLGQYQQYSIEVETLIKEINDKYAGLPNREKWFPVMFEPEGFGKDDLFAAYGVSNALVAPSSADGFVLAVPEAIAAWEGQEKDDGVIITGAAIGANQVYGEDVLTVQPQRVGRERLTDADRVTDNPIRAFNQREEEKAEDFADTLYEAYEMEQEEKIIRMKKLRAKNATHNVGTWGKKTKDGTMGVLPAAA